MIYKSSWQVEYTVEFGRWWDGLTERQQDAVLARVHLLEESGPELGYPHSTSIRGARLKNLRELRIQSGGRPLRVLYAFDPRRVAILLLGGDKTGDRRWYEVFVPRAERLYAEHLSKLQTEADDGDEVP